MTSDERRKIRSVLRVAGFERVTYTRDFGDGRYDETWRHGDGTTATISWARRTAVTQSNSQ